MRIREKVLGWLKKFFVGLYLDGLIPPDTTGTGHTLRPGRETLAVKGRTVVSGGRKFTVVDGGKKASAPDPAGPVNEAVPVTAPASASVPVPQPTVEDSAPLTRVFARTDQERGYYRIWDIEALCGNNEIRTLKPGEKRVIGRKLTGVAGSSGGDHSLISLATYRPALAIVVIEHVGHGGDLKVTIVKGQGSRSMTFESRPDNGDYFLVNPRTADRPSAELVGSFFGEVRAIVQATRERRCNPSDVSEEHRGRVAVRWAQEPA